MFGFLVGWGVFWFMIWLTLLIVSHGDRSNEGMNSLSIVMLFIVIFYFVALFIGKAVS